MSESCLTPPPAVFTPQPDPEATTAPAEGTGPEPATADPTEGGKARRGPRTPPPAPEPLLVGADQAGAMCGRSPASWWRDHAAGRCPRPLKLGGRTLWRTAELVRWVEA